MGWRIANSDRMSRRQAQVINIHVIMKHAGIFISEKIVKFTTLSPKYLKIMKNTLIY